MPMPPPPPPPAEVQRIAQYVEDTYGRSGTPDPALLTLARAYLRDARTAESPSRALVPRAAAGDQTRPVSILVDDGRPVSRVGEIAIPRYHLQHAPLRAPIVDTPSFSSRLDDDNDTGIPELSPEDSGVVESASDDSSTTPVPVDVEVPGLLRALGVDARNLPRGSKTVMLPIIAPPSGPSRRR